MRLPRLLRREAPLPEQPLRPLFEQPPEPTMTLTEPEARVCQCALTYLIGAAGGTPDESFLHPDVVRNSAAVLIRLFQVFDSEKSAFRDLRAALTAAIDQADAALDDPDIRSQFQ